MAQLLFLNEMHFFRGRAHLIENHFFFLIV